MRENQGNRFWFELARGSSYGGFELSGVNCVIHKAQSRHKAIQRNIIRTLLRHFALLILFIDSNSQLFFPHTRLYDAWAACDCL